MRFTGQVRVPEVDHPGIPATIVVEDGLAEVLLEGESLGRWSLYDVHAARLVSSAFSISLDGEEITFIADEPVDFAYKGVEHMAGVWARYKAMTIPRRVVAVGRSRRGTMPSRIPELREAMLSNLRTAPAGFGLVAPATEASPADPVSSPWAARLDVYSKIPAPIEDVEEPEVEAPEVEAPEVEAPEVEAPEVEAPEVEAPEDDAPEVDESATDETSADAIEPTPEDGTSPNEPDSVAPAEPGTSAQPPRMRPGPGLIPRPVTRIAPVPSSLSDDPVDWDMAWEEPPRDERPYYDELPTDADLAFVDEEPEREVTPAAEEDVAAEVEEPPGDDVAAVTPHEGHRTREVVLDLGRLEVDRRLAVAEPVAEPAAVAEPVAVVDYSPVGGEMLEPDLELLFAGAPVPEGERSGLFGAVRSAFARNRGGVHEHEFVEAPGGIGIVRQICAECGYISIGVSD